MMIVNFDQPQNEQKDCKLFSLPQELQIKIFRLLHKTPDMIRPQSLVDGATFHGGVSPPREGEYNDHVQLSSAFCRCCQKVYYQTIDILYHENVLCVSVIANKSLGILNKEWQVTPNKSVFANLKLVPHGKGGKIFAVEGQYCERPQKPAKIFQQIYLRIETGPENDWERLCPLQARLADLLDGKDVWVDLTSIEVRLGREAALYCVKSCRAWRCRSFQLIGRPCAKDPMVKACSRIILSDGRPRDLLQEAAGIDSILSGHAQVRVRPEWRAFHEQVMLAIAEHDEYNFNIHKEALVDYACKTLEMERQARVDKAMAAVEEAQKIGDKELLSITLRYDSDIQALKKCLSRLYRKPRQR